MLTEDISEAYHQCVIVRGRKSDGSETSGNCTHQAMNSIPLLTNFEVFHKAWIYGNRISELDYSL
jgi:hypothetical protein